MADSTVVLPALDEFFRRREASGAAERANNSMFLNELCDLLEVPRPDPAGPVGAISQRPAKSGPWCRNGDGSGGHAALAAVASTDPDRRLDPFLRSSGNGTASTGGNDSITI
jgi:hypothetical protein